MKVGAIHCSSWGQKWVTAINSKKCIKMQKQKKNPKRENKHLTWMANKCHEWQRHEKKCMRFCFGTCITSFKAGQWLDLTPFFNFFHLPLQPIYFWFVKTGTLHGDAANQTTSWAYSSIVPCFPLTFFMHQIRKQERCKIVSLVTRHPWLLICLSRLKSGLSILGQITLKFIWLLLISEVLKEMQTSPGW